MIVSPVSMGVEAAPACVDLPLSLFLPFLTEAFPGLEPLGVRFPRPAVTDRVADREEPQPRIGAEEMTQIPAPSEIKGVG